jgi:hypothetical protein
MLVPVQMQTRGRRTDEYMRIINTLRVIMKETIIYIFKNIILG